MKSRHSFVAAAALAFVATPALAQNQDHAAAPAQAGQQHAMMCTMAMLPHGNMGGGMGGMMQQGGMAHGQMQGQQGAKAPMQHGQMQGEKMQHGQMQHAQAQVQAAEKQAQAAEKQAAAMQAAAMQHGAMQGDMKHPVTPTMLIHHAQDLALTPDQVTKVTALVTASTADCQNHLKAAMDAHQSAFELLGAPSSSPDLAAYEAKLREATTHVLQAHIGVVKAGQEARALLTAEQLQKLGKHESAQAGGGHTGH